MLIIFRTTTGEIVDNTGTGGGWPTDGPEPHGPPDALAWRNIEDRAGLELLRLPDDHPDAAKTFDGRPVRVNPATRRVVFTGEPAPPPPAPSPEQQRATELRARARDKKLTDAEALEAVRLALADGRL